MKLPFIAVLVGLLLTFIPSTTAAPPRGISGVMACLGQGCDLDSGPVCAVDDSGMPRTFENKCMATLAYCKFGVYYAVVKPGEC